MYQWLVITYDTVFGRGGNDIIWPGSGIGLAFVRVVLERHGGRAALDSRPGDGTLVTLMLPTAISR